MAHGNPAPIAPLVEPLDEAREAEPAVPPPVLAVAPLPVRDPAESRLPAVALLLAMAALAWQLVGVYATGPLLDRQATGAQLDRFDTIAGGFPLLDTAAAPLLGIAVGVVALALLVRSHRRGLREPVLQGATATVSVLALLAPIAVPGLLGV